MAVSRESVSSSLRRPFFRGLAALLPTILTIFVITFVYRIIANNLVLPLRNALVHRLITTYGDPNANTLVIPHLDITLQINPANLEVKLIGVAIFIVTIVLIYFVGFFATSFIGRKIWGSFESLWTNFPFVKQIYPYAKQITEFVLSEKRRKFTYVAAVEYPRKGTYSIGFITGDSMRTINTKTGKRMVSVFIPSSPTPFTGYVVSVPHDEIIPLPISVDQAIRYTVSGGVITPPGELVGDDTRKFIASQFEISPDREEPNALPGKDKASSPNDEPEKS